MSKNLHRVIGRTLTLPFIQRPTSDGGATVKPIFFLSEHFIFRDRYLFLSSPSMRRKRLKEKTRPSGPRCLLKSMIEKRQNHM